MNYRPYMIGFVYGSLAGVVIAILVLLAGCEVPTFTLAEPPSVYATWWTEVEECSGLSGDMGRIKWVHRVRPWRADDGRMVDGQWWWPHTIALTEGSALDEWTVKHEMLHDLLQRGGHPQPPFGRC